MDSLDFELSPIAKKISPKKGRRAGLAGVGAQDPIPSLDKHDDLLASPSLSNSSSPRQDLSLSPLGGPPRNRKAGGWAASAKGGGFGTPAEDKRFMRQNSSTPDSDNDIPIIPDLDDVVEDDLTQQIAQAPSIAVNRVATYKELDSDLLRHAAFSTLDDIDLRLLTKPLVNEADVRESDIEWRWDALFTEVSSELIHEWEPDQEPQERDTSA